MYTATSGCDSLIVTELIVESSTAMDEVGETMGLRVFPNPAQEVLTIFMEAPTRGQWLEIRDATGLWRSSPARGRCS